ncbi:MAG: hypothetical protein A6F72_04760 [Cycloclasticus sp. symbiont of Poecilosclerida sp. N]|nr:MAG: hypothetical protein A6F72_04760 [Cycloclasticus sp. symbiont of Poecilosclerida sp. N]
MSVDEDGFIKSTDYTAGNLHDSNCFIGLLSGDETSVYADSAYQSQAHGAWLAERHIENRIIKRAYRNKPLNKEAKPFRRTVHSCASFWCIEAALRNGQSSLFRPE